MNSIVRVSILRCTPDGFSEMRQMMLNAEKVLRPGIESMRGLLAYYGGADEATSSLTNVSVWTDLAAAKQMDTFQPESDVIGEWERIDRTVGLEATAIVDGGHVWRPGLRFEDFAGGKLDLLM
jgi:hypothetical protein